MKAKSALSYLDALEKGAEGTGGETMGRRGEISESKRRRKRVIVTVYFFPEDMPLLEAVKRRAREEDRSIASIFWLALREYMEPYLMEEPTSLRRDEGNRCTA